MGSIGRSRHTELAPQVIDCSTSRPGKRLDMNPLPRILAIATTLPLIFCCGTPRDDADDTPPIVEAIPELEIGELDGPDPYLALSGDGTIKRRVLFSSVFGARGFAVARSQGRIFFTISSTASVVAALWPDDTF